METVPPFDVESLRASDARPVDLHKGMQRNEQMTAFLLAEAGVEEEQPQPEEDQ